MRKFISIFAALLVWVPAHAQELHPLTPHPQDVAWPTNGWTYGEMPADVAAVVEPLIDKAFMSTKSELMGETRSVVIIHRGKLVYDAHREGFTKDTKQISWSVAKSITNSLVGRAVHLGLIESIDDPMPGPWPEGDSRAEISWRHWLNMTEGLSNHELSQVPLHENLFIDMMFGTGKTDVAAFAVEHIVPEKPPGDEWKYSTAGYHMIGWALQQFSNEQVDFGICIEDRQIESSVAGCAGRLTAAHITTPPPSVLRARHWAYKMNALGLLAGLGTFDKIGMTSATPEFDAAGTYLGGSNVWASAHDYAKFGYLYLRDGVWEGERLLPEGWVDFSRTRTSGDNINTYGAGFWVTTYGEEPIRAQAITTPPWDTFNANGSEGQSISIIPSRDLVIVRTGQMVNNTENWNALFDWSQEIARAFPEVDLTPAAAIVETVAAE